MNKQLEINNISSNMGSNLLSLDFKASDIPGCNESNVNN